MPAQISSHTSFLDSSFTKDHSRMYTLCLEIGISGISYCIYHKQKNTFLGLESIRFERIGNEAEIVPFFEQILKEANWLGETFQNVLVVVNNPNNSLVPLALFNENDKKLFLEFNQPIAENATILFDILRNTQSANVFSISEILLNYVENLWPGSKKIHYSSCVIESLSNHFKNRTNNKTIYLNVREESFDIVYFKDSKLFFYNHFRFKSKEDFIYFLLIVMEQLKLSPEETKVELTGKIVEGSEIFVILNEYIRNSSFIDKNESFQYSPVLTDQICQRNFVLLNVLQCV
jgi:hypothetical protein